MREPPTSVQRLPGSGICTPATSAGLVGHEGMRSGRRPESSEPDGMTPGLTGRPRFHGLTRCAKRALGEVDPLDLRVDWDVPPRESGRSSPDVPGKEGYKRI